MLFHRIFITSGFRLAIKIIAVIMVMWWMGTILADNLICLPIEHNWDPTVPAQCGNKQLLAKIPPIPWIVTDFAILIMPLPMVWKLHMPALQRIGLGGLFLLGGLYVSSSKFWFRNDADSDRLKGTCVQLRPLQHSLLRAG